MTHPQTQEMSAPEIKYGERIIEEGGLITFPNPRPGRRYTITITLPERCAACDEIKRNRTRVRINRVILAPTPTNSEGRSLLVGVGAG